MAAADIMQIEKPGIQSRRISSLAVSGFLQKVRLVDAALRWNDAGIESNWLGLSGAPKCMICTNHW